MRQPQPGGLQVLRNRRLQPKTVVLRSSPVHFANLKIALGSMAVDPTASNGREADLYALDFCTA
jgi:hypothetical protein